MSSQSPLYRDYATYLAEIFGKMKVQKISLNIGSGCPNRDGTVGRGGCTYCNNSSFSPTYGDGQPEVLTVETQLEEGKRFFARKYPAMKYLAYFQSYTNTYGADVDTLMSLYSRAAATKDVVGIIIATRPDCLPDLLIERLAAFSYHTPVIIELGAESSHDKTLERVNRCHTWADTVDAVGRLADAGLPVGLHLIMGLPGETRQMMLTTIDRINDLPVDTIKLHQLQLIKGTRLARQVARSEETIIHWTADEYINLCCEIVNRLRPDIAIERFVSQSPDNLLLSPRWGLKNYQFTNLLNKALKAR